MKRIFLDYASTTPLDRKVFKAMRPFLEDDFGNPSAIYREGIMAKETIKSARKTVAELLNIRQEEIVFTGSGTESDNMAVIGTFKVFEKKFRPHMITTILEHPGILEAMRSVEKQGGEVTYIPVEENGIVNPQNIKQALKPSTVLVSVMLANNEIGTIQPLREISRLIDEYRRDSGSGASTPYLHTDASQAGNYLDLSFQKLGVDMMTLDSSKVYGPKGIGLLALKKHVALEPIIVGGGQERGLRAGTENVPHIVGFAAALKIAQAIREKESVRLSTLREYFFDAVIKDIPGVYIHGDREQRLPNTINICIPGIDAEFTVIKLDRAGIACSSASSCLNLSENSYSYVVDALDAARARRSDGEGRRCRESSLRFTMGRASRKKDLDLTLRALRDILITQ